MRNFLALKDLHNRGVTKLIENSRSVCENNLELITMNELIDILKTLEGTIMGQIDRFFDQQLLFATANITGKDVDTTENCLVSDNFNDETSGKYVDGMLHKRHESTSEKSSDSHKMNDRDPKDLHQEFKNLNASEVDLQKLRTYNQVKYNKAHQKGSVESEDKRGRRIGKETTRLLEEWLSLNNQDPYPSYEEKSLLCSKTGLSYKQVTNWFIHRRSKLVEPNKSKQNRYGLAGKIINRK